MLMKWKFKKKSYSGKLLETKPLNVPNNCTSVEIYFIYGMWITDIQVNYMYFAALDVYCILGKFSTGK